MTTDTTKKLKHNINIEELKQSDDISCYMNDNFINGGKQKYIKIYDWMSLVYDFTEK